MSSAARHATPSTDPGQPAAALSPTSSPAASLGALASNYPDPAARPAPGADAEGEGALPVFTPTEATERRLLTVAMAGESVSLGIEAVARRLRIACVDPVGLLDTGGRGKMAALYRIEEVRPALASALTRRPGPQREALAAERSPLLASTRTPTAGRPYRWRDPARAATVDTATSPAAARPGPRGRTVPGGER